MGSNAVRISFTVTIFILSFLFNTDTDAHSHHHIRNQSAMVVGTVYCDTCFHQHFSRLITGSVVAVECDGGRNHDDVALPSFRKEVNTNRHGVFRVQLTEDIGKQVNRIKACSVKLIKSSNPFCAIDSSSTTSSSTLRFKSRKQGIHVYSAGFFAFRPLQQPELCNQKPVSTSPSEVPVLPHKPPQTPVLPANPLQPLWLFPPNPFQPPSLFPPNPFQPPSLFPPNPFEPPPPSLLPPLPFQPSPPPFFHIPTIPGFTPPPPPPFFHIPTIPGFTPSPPPPFFHIPTIPGFTPPSPPPPAFHFPPFPSVTRPTPSVHSKDSAP